jgi:hypothetical protein
MTTANRIAVRLFVILAAAWLIACCLALPGCAPTPTPPARVAFLSLDTTPDFQAYVTGGYHDVSHRRTMSQLRTAYANCWIEVMAGTVGGCGRRPE